MRGWGQVLPARASKKTFAYLGTYAWYRVRAWIRHKHPKRNWKWLRRHYGGNGRWAHTGIELYDPGSVPIVQYRYRDVSIPSP
jgi:RNA-directed DNA polymerase